MKLGEMQRYDLVLNVTRDANEMEEIDDGDYVLFSDALAREAALQERIKKLEEALRILYVETKDYITINNLGDPHHNRSMQLARDVLHD